VIADDEGLLREGLARLLVESGMTITALAHDVPSLLRAVALDRPDVVVTDIKMPPSHTDEGLTAAAELRRRCPEVGVLVLSHYLNVRYAVRLVEQQPRAVGYLLKERVGDLDTLTEALRRIVAGESVIDPAIVERLLAGERRRGALGTLSARERQVLAAMAEGHSNAGISTRFALSPKTVERHISHILDKLAIAPSDDHNRRVLAVLTWLRHDD
jgi:DNA-binding NarL/FixJ family response regulator